MCCHKFFPYAQEGSVPFIGGLQTDLDTEDSVKSASQPLIFLMRIVGPFDGRVLCGVGRMLTDKRIRCIVSERRWIGY